MKRVLDDEYPDDRAPSLRWIKGLRASLKRKPDESWDFTEAEPEESAAVLPVMAVVIEQTLGTTRGLTEAEAACVWRIRVAVPDIDEWESYALARQFMAADPADREVLTWYLAFAPWRDKGERYANAYSNGWIDRLVHRYETPAEAMGADAPEKEKN